MPARWLSKKDNKEGLEILRAIGITDAVKVGISGSGNAKYTNLEGRIQIVQKSRYKTQVEAIRKMANAAACTDTSSKDKITTKQVKQEILEYESAHWQEIRNMWSKIWGGNDVVLSEENYGETLEFYSTVTNEKFTVFVYEEGKR